MHDLEEAWIKFEPADGVNVLAGDELLLDPAVTERRVVLHRTWESVVEQTDFGVEDSRLHLSLLPQPFFGNLSTASVFILTLNPGLNPVDYFAEFFVPAYKQASLDGLKQEAGARFPFMWFDPRFSWHSGFTYWHGRFAALVNAFVKETGIPRVEALSYFSRAVAVLELLPYHSASFGLPNRIMRQLRSVRLAKSFVADVLVPRARSGDALLVAARQAVAWGLPDVTNAIAYKGSETRGAYLTPGSRGGAAILNHLKTRWHGSA